MFMKKVLFFSLILVLFSCSRPQPKGGIIFTFDDQFVQSWVEYRNLFRKYDIKATFFISRPQLLEPDQISGLTLLQSDGHEIACHGVNHLDARIFPGPAASFYKDEAEPAISKLNEMGFHVVSFAYAFGLAPDSVDRFMLKHVKYLRKATWNMYNTSIDNYDKIYARPDSFNIVSSMGIDCNYSITLENLQFGISRAIKNDEVLVLHAHKIDATGLNYTISPAYLEQVFKLCTTNKIRSYRMQDLEDFFSRRDTTASH
jgi:peptidoglycan/xylan/chitin deacetylase (PgdA/CDA1 family)